MQAMYVGDEAETTVFGLTFPRGEAVDVSALSDALRAKLRGNGQFETSEAVEQTEAAAPKRRAAKPAAE